MRCCCAIAVGGGTAASGNFFFCSQLEQVWGPGVLHLHGLCPHGEGMAQNTRQGGWRTWRSTLVPAILGKGEGGLQCKIWALQLRWAARAGGKASVTHLRMLSLKLPRRRIKIMQPHALSCMGLQNSNGHHSDLRWPDELKWKCGDLI